MPSSPIVDFRKINLENEQFSREEIEEVIPHRFEMLQIDQIVRTIVDPNAADPDR